MQKLTYTLLYMATILFCTLSVHGMGPEKADDTHLGEKENDGLVLLEKIGLLSIRYNPQFIKKEELIHLLPNEDMRQELLELEKRTAALFKEKEMWEALSNQSTKSIRETINKWNAYNPDNPIDPLAWEKNL